MDLKKNLKTGTTHKRGFFLIPRADDVSGRVAPVSGRLCFYDHLPLNVNCGFSAFNIINWITRRVHRSHQQTSCQVSVMIFSYSKSRDWAFVSNVTVATNAHSAITSVWWRTSLQNNIRFKSIIRRVHMSYQDLKNKQTKTAQRNVTKNGQLKVRAQKCPFDVKETCMKK